MPRFRDKLLSWRLPDWRVLSWRWWLGIQSPELAAEPPQMAVTAIVPAYNEEKSIASTIESLLAQSYALTEIIVVDDCSTDATGDIARRYEQVRVVRTPENQGTKSQAQNYALSLVQTELFVTVDADTVLKPDALYEAMRFFNDPNAEVVCGTVIPQVRKSFWERGRFVEYLYSYGIMKPAQNHQGLVLVASGCFSVFRTETVRNVGGFNERTLAEDMDVTWEILNQGGRVYYASKSVSYPVEPPTFRIYTRQLDRWYRGFMQNIKVRRFRVFPQKRSMAVLVYAYLGWYGLSAIWLPGLFWLVYGNFLLAIGLALAVNVVFVWVPAFIVGVRLGLWREVLPSLPAYLLLPYVNLVIYLRAVLLELILGWRLTEWEKGH